MEENPQSIYQFNAKLNDGKDKKLADYKGKVLLIVNIASACGFAPQLKELQELRDSLSEEEFEVLGFPSNDFGGQEPLVGTAIYEFCEVNYGVKFPVFEKIMVRGSKADPIYKFLSNKDLNGHIKSTPRWNFHKYLINKNGDVVGFYPSKVNPLSKEILDSIAP